MKTLTLDPITRLEGHGRIEVFLDDDGEVRQAYFQVPELRGFESFCVGRLAEELPALTARICGICPEAHHLASTKALDALFLVTPPPAARLLRELLYQAFFVTDHATHFYVLGGPDLLVGPDAPRSERNFFGVVRALGRELGAAVVACRRRNHRVIEQLGGRAIHPSAGLPGGWSRSLDEGLRKELTLAARANVAFAHATLETFHRRVLGEPALRELFASELYHHRTWSLGTVDARNRVSFYDGELRVVDPEGREAARFHPRDYGAHLAERAEPWTRAKFAYLRDVGWRGFVDGPESGVYCVGPLARLNVADAMATPGAQEELERYRALWGVRTVEGRPSPVHHRLATHHARLIELLQASERMLELCEDPALTSPEVRAVPTGAIDPRGAVGGLEAPRGTLLHHYEADARGVTTRVNLLVGTAHNMAAMAMSVTRAARGLLGRDRPVTEGAIARLELAFRLYDPCLSCATHALGAAPLVVRVRAPDGALLQEWRRG